MKKTKYKFNKEWLDYLLKYKNDDRIDYSLNDNDTRILLTYIEILQSKIDKAIELIQENKDQVDWLHMPAWELENVLKEDK